MSWYVIDVDLDIVISKHETKESALEELRELGGGYAITQE